MLLIAITFACPIYCSIPDHNSFGFWWISEPDLSIYKRLRSAEQLEKGERYRAAARKYKKKGEFAKATECYLKAGFQESATWCYGKAEIYAKTAEI